VFEELRAKGRLPHFDALARRGSYARLATTNPAQSPVSWAAFQTGSNPGKTLIFDFLRRNPDRLGLIELSLATRTTTDEGLPGEMARRWVLLGSVAVPLLLLWGIAWLALRRTRLGRGGAHAAGLFLGLAAGGGLFLKARQALSWIPRELPTVVNNRQGVPLWSVLGQEGIKTIVLEAPVAFPADQAPNLRLTPGLGTPDAHAHWGLYYSFSEDPRSAVTAETGGLLDCLKFDAAGRAFSRIYGPEYPLWTAEDAAAFDAARLEARIAVEAAGVGDAEARRFEERAHHHATLANRLSCLLEIVRDIPGKAVTVRVASGGPRPVLDIPVPVRGAASAVAVPDPADPTLAWGAPVVVREGAWSDRVPVSFTMRGNPLVEIRAFGRFHLESVGGSGAPFRLTLAPVQLDPSQVLPNLALSSPRDFAPALAAAVGPYDTMGWPCLNNPIKDGLLSDEAFVADIRRITEERTKRFLHAAAKDDWRVLLAVFAEVDRVQHAFWRHRDPRHPLHKPEAAAKYAPFIEESYEAMDGVLGKVLAAAGPGTEVLVLSDHGMASFRRSVNLNTFLKSTGFQDSGGGGFGADRKVEQLFSANPDFFPGMDWGKTQAYALGLGQIYINLKGREVQGSVPPEKYDETCQAIRTALMRLRERDGTRVVREVYLGKDIFQGIGPETAKWAPDLVVGFEKGYRVSWQTTLGGGGGTVLEDNRLPWSGDHCSVDPSLVPGILLSSLPLRGDGASVIDVAPTILDAFKIPPPKEWDGKSLLRR
jgi:predicted AlkP superfamily phosphohydrolase/phosphomutase